MSEQKRIVIYQPWEESEAGWGVRPDGWSIHQTVEDKDAFIRDYWAGMPSGVPSEYSRPKSTGFFCRVAVPESVYERLLATKIGLRGYGHDGWERVNENGDPA